MKAGGIRALLIACQEEGRLTNATAIEALRICRNVLKKRTDIPAEVRADVEGIFQVKLVTKWQKINPDKNPGAYLGMIARNALNDVLRGFERDLKKTSALTDDPQTKTIEPPSLTLGRTLRERLELDDFRKLTINQRMRIRKEAVRLKKSGMNHCQIAREIGVDPRQVRRWFAMKSTREQKRGPKSCRGRT